MKLRQKLAVVLASAMVVTAVPVVTVASTTNKIVKSVSVLEKDKKTTGVSLNMEFDQAPDADEEFYLELTNANWLDADDAVAAPADEDENYLTGPNQFNGPIVGKTWAKNQVITKDGVDHTVTIIYRRQSDAIVRVNVQDAQKGDVINLPLPIKATGGVVSVAIKGEGSGSIVTEGSYSFISTGEKAASLSIGDLTTFYDDGELSPIILKETFLNSFASSGKDMIVKVKLYDTDFEFVKGSDVTVEGSYGFMGKFSVDAVTGFTTDTTKIKFAVDSDDKSVGYIWLSKDLATNAKSLGRLTIKGIKVDSDEKDLEIGDLLADITTVERVNSNDFTSNQTTADLVGGAELDKDYNDIVISKIANYGAYIKMKDEKAVDIVAGRDEEVTFEVIESVDDVFVGSRTVTLALKDNEGATDKSYFMISTDQKNNPLGKLLDNDDSRKIVDKIEYVWKDEADLKDTYWTGKGMFKAKEIKVTLKDADGDGKDLNDNEKIDKFKIKTKIYVPVGQQDKKTIDITGQLRGVDEFKSATAVNVIDPFDVTFDKTTLKVGLQDQKGGKISIAEKDKKMFMKGSMVLSIVDGSKENDGIKIEDKGNLTVTGDLKRTDLGDANANTAQKITLKRESKAASTLTMDGMLITVDRTVPEGFFDLKLTGDAIDEYDGDYVINDYIVIGTPNTDDITDSGLTKGTATFVIGESKYVLNDIEYQMDAPSYIQDPGYTMVPVRYVAQAFGVGQNDILFGKGTVTIFAGERTVQLTNGSNVAVVNGVSIAMGTKVTIKDGRTYAPAGEVARLLGVTTAWDSATKTATFKN